MTNTRKYHHTVLASLFLAHAGIAQTKPIFHNNAYTIYADSIVQGSYTARALSPTQLTSNYQSPANLSQSPEISFKFSINRKDNEMRPGVNHQFTCISENGSCETPVIVFGKQYVDDRQAGKNVFLAPNTKFKIRVDMRAVLASFKKDGFFSTFNGDKIYEHDFKGLYVAGATEPMVWDFDNLHQRPQLELKDPDADGIFETTMILNEEKKEADLAASWKQSADLSAFPQYHSAYNISDAIYNLSLEEMKKAVEPDSTFRTGKEWAGVWTRDISYSIILSMAYLQPAVAKKSLLKKVKNGRIIQDTGTGGAYPNSTDRIIWAVAAWELYKATGDEDWLAQAYDIIRHSVDDDMANAYDQVTGMVRGESSFLDWREQTYPKWMQPADIFESECLGTNAAHYQANVLLAEMAGLLHKKSEAAKYSANAAKIKNGINRYLWIPGKNYYGQFIYGNEFKILSPKSESLGEALAVLFGIADPQRQAKIISNSPVTEYGIPCIFPQIENIPPYHNNAVWPFVQSYFTLAAAKAGNSAAVMSGIAAIYRPAAMFLTNKENFVVNNGDYKGTQINSSNMLWSLSGNISLVHKVLFGLEFKANVLAFHPFVPMELKGKRSLTNFTYRKSVLDIDLSGYGNIIKSFRLDGKLTKQYFIAANLEGKHTIEIELANNNPGGAINEIPNHVAPETASVTLNGNNLSWHEIENAVSYRLLKNGKVFLKTQQTKISLKDTGYASYQVIAVDKMGFESFASQPVVAGKKEILFEMENILPKAGFDYKGFSGDGFVETSKSVNAQIKISVNIPETGLYNFDLRYANGNGPTNTENKCAIRSLRDNGKFLGTFIFPQRGVEEWSNWGFSNPVQARLTKGKHILNISLEPANENMNGVVNQAMLDYLRVTRIGK